MSKAPLWITAHIRSMCVVFCLLAPSWAWANSCEVLGSNAQDISGNAVKGALITIKLAGTQTLATLYNSKDCTTTITNPVTSGTTGEWSVYLKDGRFDIYTTKTGLTFQTKYDVPSFLPLGQNLLLIQEFTATQDICADGTGMIDQVGANAITVVINDQRYCTKNKTAGANLKFQFVGLGKITLSPGATLTLPSPAYITASPSQQIFDGTGSIAFTVGGKSYFDWWGASVSATASVNSAAIASAISGIPTSGNDLRFATTGSYHVSTTVTVIDKTNFYLGGVSPAGGSGAVVGTRLVWDGTAGGTMMLLDGVRDAVIEDVQFVSGTNSYGVGIDWDKVNAATQISTHVSFKRLYLSVPTAGIAYRVSNVSNTNVEDGLWDDCYTIGPSITPGSRGSSINVQIRSANSFNHRWQNGAVSGVFIGFDLPSDLGGGKDYPAGGINITGGDISYSDTLFRFGASVRHPIIVSGVGMEFLDALIVNNGGQGNEESNVTFVGNRISAPAAETVPYIDIRNHGTLTLIGNSFTDTIGANASFKISVNHGTTPGANVVAIGNQFPAIAPFDTSKNFTLVALGNTYTNGTTPTQIDDVIGAYGTVGARMLFLGAGILQANLGTPTNGTIVYCSDCTFANPCAGGGNGAIAKRLNGAWRCD